MSKFSMRETELINATLRDYKSEIKSLESEVARLRSGLKEIIGWSPCYCLSEDETGLPGGKTCPACIVTELLEEKFQ